MMTLEEMKDRKREFGYSVETLAMLSGVPEGTVRKIFSGQTRSPRRGTLERLERALGTGGEEPGYGTAVYGADRRTSCVRETAAAYGSAALQRDLPDNSYGDKRQGEYTIDDYFALPEENRYELIDGVIYDMASPTRDHQLIAGYLYYRLMTCAEVHPSACQPYMSPLDVQLDRDNRTMVQPDVIVCCGREQDSGERIFGAPDFLAEVVSPSSRRRDRFIKLNKYKNAGVREYWRIEPETRKVIVYLFCRDDDETVYTFDDSIPVFISNGMCEVSFRSLKSRMTKRDDTDRKRDEAETADRKTDGTETDGSETAVRKTDGNVDAGL